MAFDIAVRSYDYSGNEDRTWLRTRKGFDTCLPVTLDVSAFNANHLTAKGAIPSGTALAKITATGKYGPYTTADVTTGLGVCAGFLFNTTVVGGPSNAGDATNLATAADVSVPLLWEGVIVLDKLPAFAGTTDGELDASGQADLTHIKFIPTV